MKTIPLQKIDLDANGVHLLVESSIIEEGTYFIIDTGASKSVIDISLIENIPHTKIDSNEIKSSHISGMIDGQIIELKNFPIDTHICLQFQALSMSLEHINTLYEPFIDKKISGLLGGDFFDKYNATINYKDYSMKGDF
jgi:hypothetical protein